MDTDKKIEYILATVQKGYSQRQIDIDGKGGFFIRLRKGNPPKQVTLDRIYARCLELRTVENTSSNDDSKPQEQITSKDTIQPENNRSNDENVVIQRENQLIPNPIVPTNDPTSLLQTIQDLKKKVAILEKIIARQEKELAKFRSQIGTEKLQITFLDNSIPQQNHMDNSMDNSIPQQNHMDNSMVIIPNGFVLATKKVKNKIYWYAYRIGHSKEGWIYIGTDKNQATAKIEKYLRQE